MNNVIDSFEGIDRVGLTIQNVDVWLKWAVHAMFWPERLQLGREDENQPRTQSRFPSESTDTGPGPAGQ